MDNADDLKVNLAGISRSRCSSLPRADRTIHNSPVRGHTMKTLRIATAILIGTSSAYAADPLLWFYRSVGMLKKMDGWGWLALIGVALFVIWVLDGSEPKNRQPIRGRLMIDDLAERLLNALSRILPVHAACPRRRL